MQAVRRRFRLAMTLAVAVAASAVVAGCGTADPYPMLGGPGATQRSSAAIGQPVPAVVAYVTARPGDWIELLGAEAVGTLDGATVEFVVSRPILDADRNHVTGDATEPLAGAVISAEDGGSGSGTSVAVGSVIPGEPVGIVASIQAQHPGRYTIDTIRLRYRINGGSERISVGVDTIFTICAADPAPVDCPESDEEEPEG